jgi:hypothetical protein
MVGPLFAAAAACAMLTVLAGCGGGGGAETAAPEAPTTVFGRQARELAVGVAARRTGPKVALETTVLAQDGTPRRGLRVAVAGNGGWVASPACGPGRYCGEVAVTGPTPQLRVRLTRPAGSVSTLSMRLPHRPQPARAAALVHASGAAMRRLHSVVVDEVLGSGPPYAPLRTQFTYVAPDRLSYSIEGAGSAVVIGSRRWDRASPTGPWQESAQDPTHVPAPDWRTVRDASLLGMGTRDGRAVDVVSFYDPTIPAWFEVDVDRQTKLPLHVNMIGAAHFMTHSLGGFNAPITILPPV